jgi:hypothetical protein
MAKSLKYFMREPKEETVFVQGPDSFKDENGNVIEFEIKKLPWEEIEKINDGYKKRSIATDKKGNPIVSGGEVVWKTEEDRKRATRHLVAAALVYPDLKSKELMDFYGCKDITEMPKKVFPYTDEYLAVVKLVTDTLGISDGFEGEQGRKTEQDIEDAKN